MVDQLKRTSSLALGSNQGGFHPMHALGPEPRCRLLAIEQGGSSRGPSDGLPLLHLKNGGEGQGRGGAFPASAMRIVVSRSLNQPLSPYPLPTLRCGERETAWRSPRKKRDL